MIIDRRLVVGGSFNYTARRRHQERRERNVHLQRRGGAPLPCELAATARGVPATSSHLDRSADEVHSVAKLGGGEKRGTEAPAAVHPGCTFTPTLSSLPDVVRPAPIQ